MSVSTSSLNPYPAGDFCSSIWKLGYTAGGAMALGEADIEQGARDEAKKIANMVSSQALKAQGRLAWSLGLKAGAEALGAVVTGDPEAAALNPRVADLRLRVVVSTPAEDAGEGKAFCCAESCGTTTCYEACMSDLGGAICFDLGHDSMVGMAGEAREYDWALADLRADERECAIARLPLNSERRLWARY